LVAIYSADVPDDPQPIHLPLAGVAEGPLRLAQPELTTLIGLWTGATAPTSMEIQSTLGGIFGEPIDIEGEVETGDADMLWNIVVRLPGHEHPVFIWSEPSKPLDAEELGDGPEAAEGLACKWIVGLQSVLDPTEPLGSLVLLMRATIAAASDPPAVLDVEPGKWHLRPALEELFLNQDIEPPGDVLWSIHAVGLDDDDPHEHDESCPEGCLGADDGTDAIWLHTHGLWRCGKPELEMLNVPSEHALAAGHILNGIAELLLEGELAAPGEPFDIGGGLRVTARRWQDVAPQLPQGCPGGLSDREDPENNPHTGVRAAICSPTPGGADGKQLTWPLEVIQRLEQDGATLYMTQRATARLAKRARAAWPELAMAFASLRHLLNGQAEHEPAALFLVKAGLREDESGDAPREHLWFEMQDFQGDRAQGRLINQPQSIQRVKSGDLLWLDRTAISDWQVITKQGAFSPAETVGLQRFVRVALEHGETPA
jgi:uncharacterized protein YegJ (DUF2314 family)